MTSAVWATVAGAAVGGLIGLCSTLIQSHNRRKEMRLEKRLEALEPLQMQIGGVTERTCGWTWRSSSGSEMIQDQLWKTEDQAGAIWFDAEARQLLRDWVHAGRIIVDARSRSEIKEAESQGQRMQECAEKLLDRIETLKRE